MDLPATGCQHRLPGLTRPEDHPVTDAYQAPTPRRFDDLRIEQRGQGPPARLGRRACGPAARRLHPGAEMGQDRWQVVLETITEKEGDAVRGEALDYLMQHLLGHGLRARPDRDGQEQLALRVERGPYPLRRA